MVGGSTAWWWAEALDGGGGYTAWWWPALFGGRGEGKNLEERERWGEMKIWGRESSYRFVFFFKKWVNHSKFWTRALKYEDVPR
jgi:hypothetical protein